MKSILAVVLILLPGALALSCPDGFSEMQFLGHAKNVQASATAENPDACSFEIEYVSTAGDLNCQLDEDDIKGHRFTLSDCKVREGSDVSGLVQRMNDTITLDGNF